MERAEPLLRVATPEDEARVEALMKESAAAIFPRWYGEREAASAIRYVAEADPVLLADGTYFVLEAGGEIVACGGWSRRDKLYTGSGDTPGGGDSRLLDPATEPARVRAMFVRAEWTRPPPPHPRRVGGRGEAERLPRALPRSDAGRPASLARTRLPAARGARRDHARRRDARLRLDGKPIPRRF